MAKCKLVAKIKMRWFYKFFLPLWYMQCALGFDPLVPKWLFKVSMEAE